MNHFKIGIKTAEWLANSFTVTEVNKVYATYTAKTKCVKLSDFYIIGLFILKAVCNCW